MRPRTRPELGKKRAPRMAMTREMKPSPGSALTVVAWAK